MASAWVGSSEMRVFSCATSQVFAGPDVPLHDASKFAQVSAVLHGDEMRDARVRIVPDPAYAEGAEVALLREESRSKRTFVGDFVDSALAGKRRHGDGP